MGYQVGALRSDDPIWLNWVVAALGAVAVLYGAVALLRAYRSR
ncbi:hypothetical protein [Cellulomonas sp. ATA003]|nr:hypothetical protein [Cellulomonas sp. ATA003]WNB84307.1 hypothetical protein REH70_10440 [Cellulomonas sp. ATA003]